MACVSISLPIPSPPAFFVALATPSINFDATLCCKFQLSVPPIPLISVGALLNPAILAAVKANIAVVTTYVNSLPPKCPRE